MSNISDFRRNFYQIYHKEILPKLMTFEQERKRRFFQMLFVEIVVAVIAGFVAYSISQIYTVFVVGLIVLIAIPYYMNKNFIKQIKSHCMHDLTKVFGKVVWKSDVITDKQLDESELFASYNRRSCDDGFSGIYNDVPFSISETHLQYVRHSGKRRTYYTVFKGVIINVAANKNIKDKTIVTTKWDYQTKRGFGFWNVVLSLLPLVFYIVFIPDKTSMRYFLIGTIIAIVIIFILCLFFGKVEKPMNAIKLEDPVFSKKFNVYSSDEVEARYLITTAFMDRFTKLNTSFGSNKAKCSFYGDSIMFAISTNKNLFEMGSIFKRLDNPKQITIFFEEIASILAIIDYFKLDEHIGL